MMGNSGEPRAAPCAQGVQPCRLRDVSDVPAPSCSPSVPNAPRAQEVGVEGRACLLWLLQPLWFWQRAASHRPRPRLRGVSGASRAPPATGAQRSGL